MTAENVLAAPADPPPPHAATALMVLELDEATRAYQERAKAESTVRAYQSDWRHFTRWCAAHAARALPATADTVCRYLTALAQAGKKPATIQRRVSSISQAHQACGLETPTTHLAVRSLLRGIRRSLGTAPEQKAPVGVDELRRMLAACGDGPRAVRDRALLLLGFAGGFRRSELSGLDGEDLEETADGLRVTVRRSKTDPEAQGRLVGILRGHHADTCPVRAVLSWQATAGITTGPLFRPVAIHTDVIGPGRLCDRNIARVVQRTAARCGLDPRRYGGHSLRSGLATAAAAAGAEERDIARQTGHRSTAVLRQYIRSGSVFRDNVSGRVGL